MEVKVIKAFRDKVTKQEYKVGAVASFDDTERVADMVARGLAEEVAAKKATLFGQEFDTFDREAVVAALVTAGTKGDVKGFKDTTLIKKAEALTGDALEGFKAAIGFTETPDQE